MGRQFLAARIVLVAAATLTTQVAFAGGHGMGGGRMGDGNVPQQNPPHAPVFIPSSSFGTASADTSAMCRTPLGVCKVTFATQVPSGTPCRCVDQVGQVIAGATQ